MHCYNFGQARDNLRSFTGLMLLVLFRNSRDLSLIPFQICINQSDDTEKSAQVRMMGDIYERASEVIVWLGLEDSHCTFAFTSIQAISDASILTQDELLSATWTSQEGNQAAAEQKYIARGKAGLSALLGSFDFHAIVEAVQFILERPWWHRVWVIQELVLAQRAVLQCGRLVLSWNNFAYFLNFCDLFRFCYPNDSLISALMQINGLTAPLTNASWLRKAGNPITMLNLLQDTNTVYKRKTSDPRDHVYALLGLASDAEELDIRPDYSKHWAEVYATTTMSLIRKHGLTVLVYCHARQVSEIGHELLPSWSKDFGKIFRAPLEHHRNPDSIFRASGSRQGSVYFHTHSLEVDGILGGTVVMISNHSQLSESLGDRNDLRIIREWLHGLQSEFFQWKDDLWRVVITNRIWESDSAMYPRGAEDDDKAGWDAFNSEDESALNRGNETVDNYVKSAWYILDQRCLFACSDGRIGLGSCEMQPGDRIFVLLGADFPFILRHLHGNQYRLIEAAYVHGIMMGEVLDGDPHIERICIV
jgi:hypothetical protein